MKAFVFLLLITLVSAQNVTQIIRGYGYPCEDHVATTPDGYQLSLQRITHGRYNTQTKGVVFIQHGLTDSAVGVCLNAPDEGLPFFLADAGWEVWLGNNRGNGISMSNIYFTPSQDGFWNFTWDDMASSDLPTNLKYVISVTGAPSLSYIGHSEGTTQFFAGLIENPALASIVDVFIALAPVAYVHNTGSQLLRILADFDTAQILQVLGDNEFYLPAAIHQFLPDICYIDPSACTDTLTVLMGPSNNLNISRLPYYMDYEPNPTSTLNIVHWSQGVQYENFQKFDYGSAGNMAHYGQPTPPQYPLGNFPSSVPVALFTGSNDYLADPTDVATLIQQLPVPPVLVHNEPTYAHVDFIWAPSAQTDIYPLMNQLIETYNKGY